MQTWRLVWNHFEAEIARKIRDPVQAGVEPETEEWLAVPVIAILLDSHITHMDSFEVLERAYKQRIFFYNLPPHNTHRLQPLDTGLFTGVKELFSRLVTRMQVSAIKFGTSLDLPELVYCANKAMILMFENEVRKHISMLAPQTRTYYEQ